MALWDWMCKPQDGVSSSWEDVEQGHCPKYDLFKTEHRPPWLLGGKEGGFAL